MSTTAAPVPGYRVPTSSGTGIVLTLVAVGWLLAYAGVRVAWTVLGAPSGLSATGDDLVLLTGWPGVGVLVGAAAIVTIQAAVGSHRTAPPPRTTPGTTVLTVAGLVPAAALILAGAFILLDLVGGVLPGLGVSFFPLGAVSRVGCVGAAVLILVHTRRFWRRNRGTERTAAEARTVSPGWAIGAGYAAATGCLVRLGAQLAVGLDSTPWPQGPSMIIFEAGFLLAGLLLPLALVHRWGRDWPFWVPGLAGRRIPRWLLIIPGTGLGVGITAYFGVGLAQMITERLHGRNPFPPTGGLDLPEVFFWVSVPAYLVWGIGLLVGTISYTRLTAPARPAR